MSMIPTSLRSFLYGLYTRRLRRSLHGRPKPKHVAMIIDGNRRWAKQLGLRDAAQGHAAGAAKMMEFLAWCDREGVQVVTLYLLSNDNLKNRSSEELDALIDIIEKLAVQIADNARWRVHHAGSSEHLPAGLGATLERLQRDTAQRRGMHVNLAVGYGGRSEIVDAMRRIVRAHAADGGDVAALADILTPDLIAEHLYTGGQPDPDLVIRTSGEQRLSDFMLWQSAHSEFYFVEALGPDLREVDFLRALRDFASRQRRYGQ
ncbi:isoprenyl transferase [Pseudoclavibacter sp. RFBB5]|uniref:isoprenyl transferase n=1 Tax=Pseudoclavibacter sp. RFBB5 TaxID=2080574 RepID=UPI000CE8A251|nr:isoprenyl transferase [Pseudoclavibacter sp. RFBB5]PPG29776.1 isoprenyl transferase [Pseudoclavibacter sp. RFBB5]